MHLFHLHWVSSELYCSKGLTCSFLHVLSWCYTHAIVLATMASCIEFVCSLSLSLSLSTGLLVMSSSASTLAGAGGGASAGGPGPSGARAGGTLCVFVCITLYATACHRKFITTLFYVHLWTHASNVCNILFDL